MALDGLPDWLPDWCVDQLGDGPASVLFELRRMSTVFGLRLAGGRDVVVKAREDDGRAGSCVAAQTRLAERGFPCARPLQPEAVLVGAACGAFASASPPTLAAIESAAFLTAYQDLRGVGSPRRSGRSCGRPACGRRRTTPAGRPCTGTPRSPVTPSTHRQPNASAERTPRP